MQVFKIGRGIDVVCQSESTRYGFRHLATLQTEGWKDGEMAKVCYYNRTWERYTFETVLQRLCEKTEDNGSLSKYHQAKFKRLIKNNWSKEASKKIKKEFKTVAMIAKMGELLTSNKKQANDWKTRMLKAGLGGQGLIMPEDWNELSEAEKTKRLDKVIKHLNE